MSSVSLARFIGAALLSGVFSQALSAPPTSPVDPRFDSAAVRGISCVYNLEFERAEREFSSMVRLAPQHPGGHFFLAMVDWWRIVIDLENRDYDERFFAALDRVIDLCDSILDANEDDMTALFFKGGALGFQGRLRFHRNDYLAAANAGRLALPLVQRASALEPDNDDIFLGTGIYNYYVAVIPQEYPWVKPLLLFIPPGDRAEGLAQLTRASDRGRYAGVEATYFLMQVYYFYEKDYAKALSLARRLHDRFPNNMLFHRFVGRCHAALNNWARTGEVFGDIAGRARAGQRGYNASAEREACYYVAIAEQNSGRLESALRELYRCDELSRELDREEPSGFMVMANLRLGMVYDLQGRRADAIGQYTKVLKMKEYKDSHTQAERYTKQPYR
jgi:tetratricopeptide (TPR) repeat protein